ncbi:DUF45 domain-containing protein [Bifidobacterium sp. CP2]|uniref:M48 family metallopeptidase n=1 Tax=Bifidobacterium TaxID=1678 RepID=UPI001BDBFE48|nr:MULTISPECIES: SprT-like domain-containing protein [Bifidobacterium]MBT1181769.1 DUF45 domain-containing protein [Bifidobacterium sp. CP2]MBW3081611.1 DUF45 domain-containing protein [Bifidobacterium saguinibicoloris]
MSRSVVASGPIRVAAHATVEERVLDVDGLEVHVERKRIRNMYLRVKPPEGRVEVSAPLRMPLRTITAFVRDRREWIVMQRRRMEDARHVMLDRLDGRAVAPDVEPAADSPTQPFWTDARRREAAAAIEAALPALLAKWGPIIGRRPTHVTLRRMTSRWGSCTPKTGRIRLNLQLGLMEPRFLEYVLVHEMTHLWEHGHGPGFQRRMDAYLPGWRVLRRDLNRRMVL